MSLSPIPSVTPHPDPWPALPPSGPPLPPPGAAAGPGVGSAMEVDREAREEAASPPKPPLGKGRGKAEEVDEATRPGGGTHQLARGTNAAGKESVGCGVGDKKPGRGVPRMLGLVWMGHSGSGA